MPKMLFVSLTLLFLVLLCLVRAEDPSLVLGKAKLTYDASEDLVRLNTTLQTKLKPSDQRASHVTTLDSFSAFSPYSHSDSVVDVINLEEISAFTSGGYKGICSMGGYVYYAPYNNDQGYAVRVKVDGTNFTIDDVEYTDLRNFDTTLNGFGSIDCDEVNQQVVYVPYAYTKAVIQSATDLSFQVVDISMAGFESSYQSDTHFYFVPYHNGAYHGNMRRVHKTSFAVESLDLNAVNTMFRGFRGADVDDTYGYLGPHYPGTSSSIAIRIRFDDFSASGIESHDMGSLCFHSQATIVLDGYAYYFMDSASTHICRIDTATFSTTERINLASMSPDLGGWKGSAARWNQHVYAVQNYWDGTPLQGHVLRVDTSNFKVMKGATSTYPNGYMKNHGVEAYDMKQTNPFACHWGRAHAYQGYLYFVHYSTDLSDDYHFFNLWRLKLE